MSLQFDLPEGIQRFAALPIIFQHHIIHHQNVVEINRHPILLHQDAKAVPFTDGIVGDDRRVFGVFLIVV